MSARQAFAIYLEMQANARAWRRPLPWRTDPLEALSAFVQSLPEADPRLVEFGTLAVRKGVCVPGPAVEQTLLRYRGGQSLRDLELLLRVVVQRAVDDAVARAREYGVL